MVRPKKTFKHLKYLKMYPKKQHFKKVGFLDILYIFPGTNKPFYMFYLNFLGHKISLKQYSKEKNAIEILKKTMVNFFPQSITCL